MCNLQFIISFPAYKCKRIRQGLHNLVKNGLFPIGKGPFYVNLERKTMAAAPGPAEEAAAESRRQVRAGPDMELE